MEFSRPFTSIDMSLDGTVKTASEAREFKGTEIKAIFVHAPGDAPLVVRVGISCTSVEGAAKDLATELPHWDFDAVSRQAEDAWGSRIQCS